MPFPSLPPLPESSLDREPYIRAILSYLYPDIKFAMVGFTESGFGFSVLGGKVTAQVHVFTIMLLCAHLDDQQFLTTMEGICELVHRVYQLTGRRASRFLATGMQGRDVIDAAMAIMEPRLTEALSDIWTKEEV